MSLWKSAVAGFWILAVLLGMHAESSASTIPAATGSTVKLNGGAGFSSDAYATVLSQTINVDADKTGLYDIGSQLSFFNASGDSFWTNGRLVVDGTPLSPVSNSAPSSSSATLNSVAQLNLAAGSHTIELQLNTSNHNVALNGGVITATGYNSGAGIPAATGSTVTSPAAGAGTAFTTVLSQNINVDADKTGLYNINSQLNFYNSGQNPHNYTRLVIDGNPLPYVASSAQSGTFGNVSVPAQIHLTPGLHTVELQSMSGSPSGSQNLINLALTATGFNNVAGTPAATGSVVTLQTASAISVPVFTTVLSQDVIVDNGKTGLYDIQSQISVLSNTLSSSFMSRLIIDGVPVATTAGGAMFQSFGSLTLPAQVNLSPGPHTIALQILSPAANSFLTPSSGTLMATGYNAIVPEPAGLFLAGLAGLALLGLPLRRKKLPGHDALAEAGL